MSGKLVDLHLMAMIMLFMVACAQTEYYKVPNDRDGYAVIDDDVVSPSLTKADEFVRIQSVDRIDLSAFRDGIPEYLLEEVADTPSIEVKNAIVVTPGEHKLLINACQESAIPNILGENFMCATTVIRLQTEDGGRYRVGGSVSKERDHADIWIKDLRTGEYVVKPMRIRGLQRKDGWEAR